MKVNGNLARIRELTARLTDTFEGASIKAGDGSVYIARLYACADFGIMKFQATAGAVHDKHYHPMNEWIGIGSGKLIAEMDGKKTEVHQHEVLLIPANAPHVMSYPVDTEGWVITMPKDEGF